MYVPQCIWITINESTIWTKVWEVPSLRFRLLVFFVRSVFFVVFSIMFFFLLRSRIASPMVIYIHCKLRSVFGLDLNMCLHDKKLGKACVAVAIVVVMYFLSNNGAQLSSWSIDIYVSLYMCIYAGWLAGWLTANALYTTSRKYI